MAKRKKSTEPRRQSKDPLERLDTPDWVTRALIARCPAIRGKDVIEPCAGASAMSRVLREEAWCRVVEFDIEPRSPSVKKANTLQSAFWDRQGAKEWSFGGQPVGCVATNPMFSGAGKLLRLARWAGFPLIALLVRLSWLEAAEDREDLPDPNALIVVPRPKFIESPEARAIREAAGKKWGGDSVTVCWAIWATFALDIPPIQRVNRKEKAVLEHPLRLENIYDRVAP